MNTIFESINNTSDKAVDVGEKYIKDTQEYYKLKIFQQLTITISLIAKAFIIGGLLFIGLMFLAAAAAIAIGESIENPSLGYVIVAVIFMIIGAIVYSQRAFINRKIIATISPKFFNS